MFFKKLEENDLLKVLDCLYCDMFFARWLALLKAPYEKFAMLKENEYVYNIVDDSVLSILNDGRTHTIYEKLKLNFELTVFTQDNKRFIENLKSKMFKELNKEEKQKISNHIIFFNKCVKIYD